MPDYGLIAANMWRNLMDIDKLKDYIPGKVLTELPSVMDTFNINSPLRLCHFLAQCSHESINFTAVSENLNYSKRGLLTTFKKYFPTEQLASEYERQPEKIANRVYANRMGNGPESSGDGWLYRGRGYIQLTGKINYRAFNSYVSDDIVLSPGLVATKYPLLSAGWFWDSRKLNSHADKGSSDEIITNITKIVNGGTNGLSHRITMFNKYYSLF